MRRSFLLPALVCLALPATAAGQETGGASPPSADDGGTRYGAPVRPAKRGRKAPRRMTVGAFSVSATVQPGGAPAVFRYRIDGPERSVRVRIDLVRPSGLLARRIRLGYKRTGQVHSRSWSPTGGELAAGRYVARLHATDGAGRVLIRTARASGRSKLEVREAPVVVGSGVFPVQGPYTLGGHEAKYGADRGDHSHQGHDIMGAEGTPIVAPRSGVVFWKKFQESGAGHYVVVRGDDGRDYVFMHLQAGSILVEKDARVTAGQQIASMGNTGRSSAPHLHFEIWPDGWYAKGSVPIDPLPELQAWAKSA